MYKAIKLTAENLPMLAKFVSPLVYADYKMEFEFNTEDGMDTYATMQDYINSGDNVLVYLHEGRIFNEMFQNADAVSTTEFTDVVTNK